MKISQIEIRNFRRLEGVSAAIEERETVFVGPNNSGKTSATTIFRCFLGYRRFRIYDFSVSKIAAIDAFGASGDVDQLPSLQLDIWFRVDPESIEFGRAFTLLPNLSDDFDQLGLRLSLGASEPHKLRDAYLNAFPSEGDGPPPKRLSEFLSRDAVFNQFFEVSYASLEKTTDGVSASRLEQSEGRKLLQSLIRIDFVDAQRNIDDDEGHRANRLSSAFAGFYRSNLEQVEAAAEAQQVIDKNNEQLTAHYKVQFSSLLNVIKGLGVPSVNDRDLKIVSTLSPEAALRGNTDLLYVDAVRSHELPELYNGLGFKNLIYMAIQAKHYHSQWLRTPTNRPLCHVIFIEEPEVHLHAQVQQTFIRNIWEVIEASAVDEGEKGKVPQLIVTTHSSHILDATEFAKVRYFRRCRLADDPQDAKVLNATKIHSLRDFRPEAVAVGDQTATEDEALEFLKRYLRLTHCDLFFADAAVLVEGAAEKLLLPSMIDKVAGRLRTSYLTVLEIGGAYAHRFDELLSFLCIPSLVITDLDSVGPEGNHPSCRADHAGALTSNASLKRLLSMTTVAELKALSAAQKLDEAKGRRITFQGDIQVADGGASLAMCPRTFEEAIAYQNFTLLRSGDLNIGINIPAQLDEAYEAIWKQIGSSNFKKTDFAMDLLAGSTNWQTPNYIVEGLQWLESRLHGPTVEA
jgi:predicted ATP-dependent endonuclease of OLD family